VVDSGADVEGEGEGAAVPVFDSTGDSEGEGAAVPVRDCGGDVEGEGAAVPVQDPRGDVEAEGQREGEGDTVLAPTLTGLGATTGLRVGVLVREREGSVVFLAVPAT